MLYLKQERTFTQHHDKAEGIGSLYFAMSVIVDSCHTQEVVSSTLASGAFVLTDAMPFSMAEVPE